MCGASDLTSICTLYFRGRTYLLFRRHPLRFVEGAVRIAIPRPDFVGPYDDMDERLARVTGEGVMTGEQTGEGVSLTPSLAPAERHGAAPGLDRGAGRHRRAVDGASLVQGTCASYCGRSSLMLNHGALEPTKM
jgi:hypothetical protein